MKQIQAVIQAFKVGEVTNVLQEQLGIGGITVLEVKGYGVRRGPNGLERRATGSLNYEEKALVLLVVRDHQAATAMDLIAKHAHTGQVGDGLAVVLPVEDAVRIRTGLHGEAFL